MRSAASANTSPPTPRIRTAASAIKIGPGRDAGPGQVLGPDRWRWPRVARARPTGCYWSGRDDGDIVARFAAAAPVNDVLATDG